MCYCPHFSDEETLVKKSHNSLHRGRGYLPGHLDQNQVFRLLAGLFLLCLSYGVGMTNFYSCPHRTKIEKLKQHKEGLIHRQGGTASARTRGKLWILSPRGDFKERADQLPVADGTAHPPTSPASRISIASLDSHMATLYTKVVLHLLMRKLE